MNDMCSKIVEVKEIESTEMRLVEKENTAISETSNISTFSSIKGNDQTVVKETSALPTFEERQLNYNKPWRQIIKRRVVDGGNYDEG